MQSTTIETTETTIRLEIARLCRSYRFLFNRRLHENTKKTQGERFAETRASCSSAPPSNPRDDCSSSMGCPIPITPTASH